MLIIGIILGGMIASALFFIRFLLIDGEIKIDASREPEIMQFVVISDQEKWKKRKYIIFKTKKAILAKNTVSLMEKED